jgi:4-hydroxybenzoate polyprenyltransferase
VTKPASASAAPADAGKGSWVNRAPLALQPYLRLSRYDRPVGFWLLGLPCLMGLALARLATGFAPADGWLALLFAVGAVAMRGAGCTYNDILDQDIDAKVERTALRPLPSGAVSNRQAWVWLLAQCLVGLGVLLALPRLAQYVALGAIPMVALYPLMKRITWWPQIWLGLTFNWGVLVAAAATQATLSAADLVLYVGLIFWTLGYDTIYALQDREDDALIGVKSTARRFGSRVKPAITIIYTACCLLVAAAGWIAAGPVGAGGAAFFVGHLVLQAVRLAPDDGGRALILFKANRDAGLLLVISWAFIAALN